MAFDQAPVDVHVDGVKIISKGRVWWRDSVLYGAKRIKGGVSVQVVAAGVEEPVADRHKWWTAGDAIKLYACGCGAGAWRKYTTDGLEAMISTNGDG